MKDARFVGGLWCTDVLERLSSYVDGDLEAGERANVEEHLRGCAECTRFGGEFSSTVRALRAHLAGAEDGLSARSKARLRDALARGGG